MEFNKLMSEQQLRERLKKSLKERNHGEMKISYDDEKLVITEFDGNEIILPYPDLVFNLIYTLIYRYFVDIFHTKLKNLVYYDGEEKEDYGWDPFHDAFDEDNIITVSSKEIKWFLLKLIQDVTGQPITPKSDEFTSYQLLIKGDTDYYLHEYDEKLTKKIFDFSDLILVIDDSDIPVDMDETVFKEFAFYGEDKKTILEAMTSLHCDSVKKNEQYKKEHENDDNPDKFVFEPDIFKTIVSTSDFPSKFYCIDLIKLVNYLERSIRLLPNIDLDSIDEINDEGDCFVVQLY